MEYYFDTCSLIALARYFSPFDSNDSLYEFIHEKYVNKEILILDAIYQEARNTSQGIALKNFPFIEEKKDLIVKTTDLLPCSPRKFDNMLERNFTIPALKKTLKIDFSILKQQFLLSGDGKLILTMYNRLHEDEDAQICIVTEESRVANDDKVFKKIPALCEQINARCITLVDYLRTTSLHLSFEV